VINFYGFKILVARINFSVLKR